METTGSHHRNRLRWLLTLAVVVLGFLAVQLYWRASSPPEASILLPPPIDEQGQTTATAVPLIGVDVVGAVRRPGLYYLSLEARIDDAIKAAGGLSPDANRDAVNLAARLQDEQQIRVPRVGEIEHVVAAGTDQASPTSDRLDLNVADQQALERLPGIGPQTAQKIVAYRAANGPFRSVEQLDDVDGVGAATIDELRALVTVANQE